MAVWHHHTSRLLEQRKSPLTWAVNLESIQLCCKSREGVYILRRMAWQGGDVSMQ